ncbi:MAG: cell division protein FtsL [Devosia sp.]
MIRSLNILLVCSAICMLVAVYALKYSVEDVAAEKVSLQRQIERQQADLSLLKADWAYLNQPGHVEPIIQRHQQAFNLAPATATQFLPIDAIPMRPQQPDSAALDDLFKSLASGVDPANTGTGGH